jgi:hypothetical protein
MRVATVAQMSEKGKMKRIKESKINRRQSVRRSCHGARVSYKTEKYMYFCNDSTIILELYLTFLHYVHQMFGLIFNFAACASKIKIYNVHGLSDFLL